MGYYECKCKSGQRVPESHAQQCTQACRDKASSKAAHQNYPGRPTPHCAVVGLCVAFVGPPCEVQVEPAASGRMASLSTRPTAALGLLMRRSEASVAAIS